MSHYEPPITLTPELLSLTATIAEQLGRITERKSQAHALRLRRISRLQTIQGSLAIEGNSLNVEQITSVIEGKPIIAPPREVQEVKNALAVYDRFEQFDPLKEQDLLTAHRALMLSLVDEVGHYRNGSVGVMSGQQVVHMAPPANQVPRLMRELFNWLKHTKHHPLLASAIFHYEFEFIHPFSDGNGRMGRLWQSLILAKWNSLFSHFPIESLVHAHQENYYQAIAQSTAETDSGIFAVFMLRMIEKTLAQHLDEIGKG
jgi:Fic family protein